MSTYDVAIVGGGPAGSATATLIKKYAPYLSVLLLEREKFPRDHVGESLLPIVCRVLAEMGCWDEIERANFPVKIGATYRWGTTDDLWDFDFLAGQRYQDAPRPSPYTGQRTSTAFQVDRAVFDKVLLDHARKVGVEVREQTKVVHVDADNDEVKGLGLEDGSTVRARHYVDASGHSGIIRRAVGVKVQEPSALRNIAIWSYWQNAEWAVNVGVSGTRVQVMSLGWGWLWFIPLGPTRTSIGLVTSADYFKNCGRSPERLYLDSIKAEPNVSELVKNAEREAEAFTTKDWSFLAEKFSGPNWFLVGESAGFADPILAAGISMAMVGALELATTIKELESGEYDPSWLREEYGRATSRRIKAHIRFADYWYTANAHFTDLVETAREIAQEAGLNMDGAEAWRWLGTGGFVAFGSAGIAGYDLVSAGWLFNQFSDKSPDWNLAKFNVFKPSLEGARREAIAIYDFGKIQRIEGLAKGNRILPVHGIYRFIMGAVTQESRADRILKRIKEEWCIRPGSLPRDELNAYQILEALLNDGWIEGSFDPDSPKVDIEALRQCTIFHANTDNRAFNH